MSEINELRKRIAFAISDPGHAGQGYKGERTLTEWQTDAVMAVVADALAHMEAEEGWEDISTAGGSNAEQD